MGKMLVLSINLRLSFNDVGEDRFGFEEKKGWGGRMREQQGYKGWSKEAKRESKGVSLGTESIRGASRTFPGRIVN